MASGNFLAGPVCEKNKLVCKGLCFSLAFILCLNMKLFFGTWTLYLQPLKLSVELERKNLWTCVCGFSATATFEPWCGTFIWNHASMISMGTVEPFFGTFRNLGFACGTFAWNLPEPGSRLRPAAPNHPSFLLTKTPQTFKLLGRKHEKTSHHFKPTLIFRLGIEPPLSGPETWNESQGARPRPDERHMDSLHTQGRLVRLSRHSDIDVRLKEKPVCMDSKESSHECICPLSSSGVSSSSNVNF